MTAELTRQVKAQARRLGFDLVGVTTPEPPPHYPKFLEWLQAGRHGEMGYLARERSRQRRADPRRILPECRSILVLGVHHQPPLPAAPEGEPPHGRVAAYAWGDDYHDVLVGRLQALHAFIERLVGRPVAARGYTDTGPLLERDLAQRAGLGWIGKNTCLINPQAGSYFLLAELLLDLPLAVDEPLETDHCGTCTRCIEACPTACILPDRTLDARRCISYLTIELKGPIPADLRPQMGSWVFGCDVCQAVCPWNQRFAPEHGDPAFAPRPLVPAPDLVQELALTPEDFNRKFKGSPVKRAKRRGYLRNVAVALGNTGSAQALPALAQALHDDPEPLVRSHAAWALGRYPGHAARTVLARALPEEPDEAVRAEIQAALAQMEEGGN
jgi:epoxyqueuosine reductase